MNYLISTTEVYRVISEEAAQKLIDEAESKFQNINNLEK